jgi:tyrosinase
LNAEERKAYVEALLALKKRGRYDQYVHWHHHVMMPSVLPYEPRDANYRNGAHRGPSFLPWHREFLMQVEADLRSVDASLTIPYWDWTEDAALDDPKTSPLWDEDFMGGDGVEADQWRVATGPFAYGNGNWNVPAYPEVGLPGPGLKRFFGRTVPTLPTKEDVALALAEPFYDTPNFNQSPFTTGFRNRLEGWITQRGDPRVKTSKSQLHMLPMTSPDDPVFFLYHCFIDKVWADWQDLQRKNNPDASPHYAPEKDGPPGHNLDDPLHPWKRTIREVLDISKLDYAYEQPAAQPELLAMAKEIAPTSPFMAERSPFWAD